MVSRLRRKFTAFLHARALGKEDDKAIVARVRAERLSYLSDAKFRQIIRSLRKIEKDRIPGLAIEAGCALGGSALVISSYLSGNRKLNIYDTFAMIPPPTAEDPPEVHARYEMIVNGKSHGIGGDTYYGYRGDLYEFVHENLRRTVPIEKFENITLVKGLLQETMRIEGPVAFAHIDVDWYDPVRFCLETLWPAMSPGGVVILDDYFDWGGCRKATDEYLLTRTDFRRDESARNLKLIKR